jgi:hypothetical protein
VPKIKALTELCGRDYHFALPLLSGGFLATIRIPDRYKPGLSVLGRMSETDFDLVFAGLKASPAPSKGQKELTAWISSEAKTLIPTDLKRMIDALASLYRLRTRSEVSPDVLANDVKDAAAKDGYFQGLSADILRDRLVQLLALDSLNVVDAKAKELQLEAEHRFCDTRIVTDLRPVFGGNVVGTPEAMIIVHTLKIGYHDSNDQKHKEMYFALDADDLAALSEALKRAQDKTKALKAKMDSVGIATVDLS